MTKDILTPEERRHLHDQYLLSRHFSLDDYLKELVDNIVKSQKLHQEGKEKDSES
jgi:hypothetical protein